MIRISLFGPRRTDFYDEEIERLKQVIKAEEPNSDEWVAGMTNLAQIEQAKHNAETKPDYGKVIQAIASIGGLAVSAVGLGLTYETAKMAYADDAEMRMKNGNVWRIKDDYRNYYKAK